MKSTVEQAGTIEKAIDVLFHLHAEGGPRGVTSIGRELGIPKSSVHRLLAALSRRSLVERDERGQYRPGVGLVALGLGVLEQEPVVAAARPVLERFAGELGETFFLVAARAGTLVVLEKVEGTGFLRAAPQVGATVPASATAVGKLYLAHAPEAISRQEAESVEAFTPETLTSKADLERAVDEARRLGYASNREEWIPGLSVLAAPIWLGDRMVAAVALALPSARLAGLNDTDLIDRVTRAARRIGERLSGVRGEESDSARQQR